MPKVKRPILQEMTAVVVAALLLCAAFLFVQYWWGHWLFLALLATGPLAIVAAWARARSTVSNLSLIPVALLLFYYCGVPDKIAPHLVPNAGAFTYDAFLYHADCAFGFVPSVLVCSLVGRIPYLNDFFFGVYMLLAFAMGCCYASHIQQPRLAVRIAVTLAVTATIGVLCYNLLPASGPLMLLGRNAFLHGSSAAPHLGEPALVEIPLRFPRNAMPSLHMTWALLVLWISRDLKRGRWLAAIFACLTATATLSTGEHYLVDLLAAFPFTLAIWSLFSFGELPLLSPQRTLRVAGGVAGYLIWIGVLRGAPDVFYISPAVPWLLAAVTVVGTLFAVYSLPVAQFNATAEHVRSVHLHAPDTLAPCSK